MSSEQKMLDIENGGVDLGRQTDSKSTCFWRALCAVAVLGLLAVSAYLLLCQLGVLPSNQKVSLNSEPARSQGWSSDSAVTTVPVHNGLPALMQQVGNNPRGKIAAHLTALSTSEGKNVIWQYDSDSTFAEGVDFRDNSLVITTPGQYFVYTQVVFYSSRCQGKSIFLSHELAKSPFDYPEEALLLKATKSVCHYGQREDTWYKTSYQGAVFEFDAGDKIFSRVSEEAVKYVDSSQGKSFFWNIRLVRSLSFFERMASNDD